MSLYAYEILSIMPIAIESLYNSNNAASTSADKQGTRLRLVGMKGANGHRN